MWQVIGQNRAVSLLQGGLERNSLAHAYLFVGPAHVGKMALALNLAQALNCENTPPPCGECASCQKIAAAKHADVQVIRPNGESSEASENKAMIGVSQIEELQHAASLPPFEGRCKIFVIDGAELLSNGASNRLLKTLEEPVARVVFILLTTNEHLMPATVISRCQRVELSPLGVSQIEAALHTRWGVELPRAKLLARLAHGCLGWAVSAALDSNLSQQRSEQMDELLAVTIGSGEARFTFADQLAAQFSRDRASVQEKLNLWLDWWRDLLLVKTGLNDAVTNIDRSAKLGEIAKGYSLAQIRTFIKCLQAAGVQLKLNANPRLVLEALMLDMPEASKIA